MTSSITAENGSLIVRTPYDPGLVTALKSSIPPTERRWDNGRKAWIIAAQHGKTMQTLIDGYLNENVSLPQVVTAAPVTVTKIIEVRYIGACKDRPDGTTSAFGFSGGDWSVVFPQKVLESFFDAGVDVSSVGESKPKPSTLYAVLGVGRQATDDQIKAAYRRMARQWHPDICKEPDARERFIEIQHAYEVLAKSNMRARYDAGLKLEESLQHTDYNQAAYASSTYRSPLRCGLLICEGVEILGRFIVSKIKVWEDITQGGKTLVVSWPAGADKWREDWV